MKARSTHRIIPSIRTLEGGGFSVRRPFPTHGLEQMDPFLLLDEMGPMDCGPGEAVGAPDHPHRGFETVTYLLSGAMVHRDSHGNHGQLNPGDVQWMTAGSGVIHSELPEPDFKAKGGRMHGFQIWVNLPKGLKMTTPRYQDVPADRIPTAERDGVHVRVIAGAALGQSAVIDTHIPITYLHFTLAPGARVEQPLDAEQTALAYIFEGRGRFGSDDTPARDGDLVSFAADGDHVTFTNDGTEPLQLLLLGGRPLHEPIARYGPFVMNTREEIVQAFNDFQSGRFGAIPAHT